MAFGTSLCEEVEFHEVMEIKAKLNCRILNLNKSNEARDHLYDFAIALSVRNASATGRAEAKAISSPPPNFTRGTKAQCCTCISVP